MTTFSSADSVVFLLLSLLLVSFGFAFLIGGGIKYWMYIKKFLFKIHRRGVLSNIGKAVGMQDIEIGYDYFDNAYIIKGNDEVLLRKLMQNHTIRNLIEKQQKIVFEIEDDEGKFGPKFNNDESELSFIFVGVIKDKERLKNLFELFEKVIDELEMIGITVNQMPEVILYCE